MNGLQSLTPCTTRATPGAGKLEYCPLDEADTAVYHRAVDSGGVQRRSVGVTSWYSIPYLPESGRWRETKQTSVQGVAYSQQVSCTLAGDTAAIRREMQAMAPRFFLLRLTRGSQVVVIGTPETPMTFADDFDSGSTPTDPRVHNIAFTGVTLYKTPGYNPTF